MGFENRRSVKLSKSAYAYQHRLLSSDNHMAVKSDTLWTRFRVMVVLVLGAAAVRSGTYVMLIVFPAEAVKRDISQTTVGLVYGSLYLGELLLLPFSDRFILAVAVRRSLVVSLAGCALTTAVFGALEYISNCAAFVATCIVCLLLQGCTSTIYQVTIYGIAAGQHPESRNTVMAALQTALITGGLLGSLMGGFLHNWGGYGLPFYTSAAAMAATMAFSMVNLQYITEENPSSKIPVAEVSYKSILRLISSVHFWLWAGCLCKGYGDVAILNTTVIRHVTSALEAIPLQVSYLNLARTGSMLVSYLFSGLLFDCQGRKRLLVTLGAFLLLNLCATMMMAPPPPLHSSWLQLGITFVLQASLNAILLNPTFPGLLQAAFHAGLEDSLTTKLLVSRVFVYGKCVGLLLAPIVTGFLYDHCGFSMVVALMSAFNGALLVLLAIVQLFYPLPATDYQPV